MPHRRCRKSSAMFLCGVLGLFFWQSTIYPVSGQSGSEPTEWGTVKVEKSQNVEATEKLELTEIVTREGDTRNQIPNITEVKTYEINMEDIQPSRGMQVQVHDLQEQSSMDQAVKDQAVEDQISQEHASQEIKDEQTAKIEVSKAELDLLARVIYAEARGENFEGQVAVGAVVLNRLDSSDFPKTIYEVIYQPGAFTAVIDKQIHLTPDGEAYRAAEKALAGQDPTEGALYYFNPKTATDRWIKSRAVIKQIGNHTFSI